MSCIKLSLEIHETAMRSGRPARRFFGIQVLRGYAAWLVVFHHFHQVINKFDVSTLWGRILNEFGGYAVYIFFVISGVVIHHSVKQRDISAWVLLKQRFFRIALPYWVATAIFTLFIFLFFGNDSARMWNPMAMLMSMMFVAFPHPSGLGFYPVLTVGWSLNYEVLFYVLVSIFLAVSVKRWALLLGLVLMFLPWAWQDDWIYGAVLSEPVWMLFPAGMMLSHLFEEKYNLKSLPGLCALAVVFLATAVLLGFSPGKSVAFKMASGVTLVGLTLLCESWFADYFKKGSLFMKLGEWSYSTYLLHMMVLVVIQQTALMQWALQNKVIASCIYGLIVLVVSKGFHDWVERPALRWIRSLNSRSWGAVTKVNGAPD